MQRSLAQKLTIALGRLALRSDVEVTFRRVGYCEGSGHPFDRKAWTGILPEPVLDAYAQVNGYAMNWRFQGDTQLHGPLFCALVKGKKTIDLRTGRFAVPLTKVGSFGKMKYGDGRAVDAKLRALLIEGSDDAAGLMMLLDEALVAVVAWDNDGIVAPLAATFEEALDVGLASSFAFMWRYPAHEIPSSVRERLGRPVPPRVTHRVHITGVEPSSGRAFREAFGASLHARTFDDAMKLAKVKAKHASLSEPERGRQFADAFARPDAVPAESLPKLAFFFDLERSVPPDARTPELLSERLRLDERATVRVTYRIENQQSGLPSTIGGGHGFERVLSSVTAFHGLARAWGDELEVLQFCPGAAGPHRLPQLQNTSVTDGPGRSYEVVAFLDAEAAEGMKVGSYDASSLAPSVDIG